MSATTTDSPDGERAERLARLQARRAATETKATGREEIGATFELPSTRQRTARRGPASAAKVVTAGASATAVLGLMTGYALADRTGAPEPVLVDADTVGTGHTDASTSTPATSATSPPIVIVVRVVGAAEPPFEGSVAATAPSATAPSAAPPPTAAAVPMPAVVDLAVPAPPPPPTRTAASSQTPVPQAQSSGS